MVQIYCPHCNCDTLQLRKYDKFQTFTQDEYSVIESETTNIVYDCMNPECCGTLKMRMEWEK